MTSNTENVFSRKAAEAGRKNVSASRPGIKNAVLAVAGVSYVTVNTNRRIETDSDGLPGKSVQVLLLVEIATR